MAETVISIDVIVRATQAEQGAQQAIVAIQKIGDEAKATAEKAKASLSLLSEELGVKIPGEVQSLIAQLPGVGTALKAAFSATVVIAIIQVLAEIAEKIETLSQRAEKHREAWAAIQSTMDETTQKTVSALDHQKAKYIELTQGPLKAMEYELQHMHSIALTVFPAIASEMEKLAQQFSDEGGRWTEWQRANKEAGKDMKKTLADTQEAMSKAIKSNPKDLLAPFDAALGVVQGKVDAIEKEINELPKTQHVTNRFTGGEDVAINQENVSVLNQKKEALSQITNQLEAQKELQKATSETAAEQKKLADLKDEIAARTQALSAQKSVEDAKRKLAVDTARFQLEQGKITVDQAEEIEKAALKKELDDTTQNLRARQRLQLQDTSLTENQKKAIIQTTNAEIKAAQVKYNDDVLQVDAAANKQKTQDFLVQVQAEVVATKAGSRERVAVYKNALDQMRQLGLGSLADFRHLEEQITAAAHEYEKKQIKDKLALDEEEIHHTEQMALLGLDIRRKEFENEILAHKKKNSEVIAQEQEFLKQELKIKVDALTQKLRAMEKDPDVSPIERKKIEDQILELQKQYALKAINIKKDEVNRRKQLEQAFQSTLQSSFSSGIMGMLKGTESFAQAMRDLYAGLVQDVVNMLSQMLAEWIGTHVLMKLFGIHSQKETATASITASAAQAGAATYADMASLGPEGLAMAPEAAWASYGEVMTFVPMADSSMAGGMWEVDRERLARIHEQEMVLPAKYAAGLREMIESGNGSSTSAGDIHVHVNHSVNAVDAESFQGVIRRHGNIIGNEVARVLKTKGYARNR
jgi:hypothetical protein